MTTSDHDAIRAIIARQFRSLNWDTKTTADWDAFLGDFLPGAQLYPAARPVKSQTPDDFVARMKRLAATKLLVFNEVPLGSEIRVFGNVAVAVAACKMTENGAQVTRGIEMMLLVKSEGRWQIAAQTWDTEGEGKVIPSHLLAAGQ